MRMGQAMRSGGPRRITIGVLLCAAALITGFAAWRQQPSRLNVIIVTLDTTRADRIGCYGAQDALTPVLDGLANRGVLFEQALTPIPLTLPSHASMFTGLYPPEHGLRTNGKHCLSDEIPTLAEACRAKGYDTGAFVASFVLDSKFGLDRGFETYDDDLTGTDPTEDTLHRNRSGERVVDRALGWLKLRGKRPFFCWVHLYDPHAPYLEHRDLFDDRFAGRPYDAEIAYVDLQLDRLLNVLSAQGLEPQTLVVVVGDHGEGLEQHGERYHGHTLYDSTLHVPWIMSLPGVLPQNQRIATPVSLVDLYPTVTDMLKLKGSTAISGKSLLPAVEGKSLQTRALYAETDEPWLESGWSPLRAIVTDQWKYVRTTRPELFQRPQDPQEINNLAAELPEQLAALERELADLESSLRHGVESKAQLSDQDRQKLSGLGYLGHAGSEKPLIEGQTLHDIKDMIGHYYALDDARLLLDAGDFAGAEAALRKIIDAAPDYELAEITLGDVFLNQRKLDEARSIYQGVLQRNPESALAMLHLGDVCEAEGRYEQALEFYLEALKREPDAVKLTYNIGRVLVLLNRDDEAMSYFRTVLDLDPGFVSAHIELGSALARQGMRELALAQYDQALNYDPRSILAHMNAASVLSRQRRAAEALSHLEQAAEIAPQDTEVRFQLAAFLAAQGEVDRARSHLNRIIDCQPDHAEAKSLLDDLNQRRP